MYFFFVLIISLFPNQAATAASDTQILAQAKHQSEYYLDQVGSQEQNRDLYFWALAALCDVHPEVRDHINGLTKSPKESGLYQTPFCGDHTKNELLRTLALKTGSGNLLLAYLLELENKNEQKQFLGDFKSRHQRSETKSVDPFAIAEHIIQETPVDSTSLSYRRFSFPHYLLLYNNSVISKEILPPIYINNLKQRWKSYKPSFDEPTLYNSLFLFSWFRIFYLLDEYARIGPIYQNLVADSLLPPSDTKMNIYRYLDYSMYRLGYFDRNIEIVRTRSLPLARFLDNQRMVVSLLIAQGINLYKIGKIQESKRSYEQALQFIEANDIPISTSTRTTLFNNLSITYWKSGDFNKYLEFQFKSLDIAEEQKNYSHQLDIFENLFVFYRRNNELENSKLYLSKATDLAKSRKDTVHLIEIYIRTGKFYKDTEGDFHVARQYFTKADSLLNDKSSNYVLYKSLLQEQAELAERQNNISKAIGLYQKIQSWAKKREDGASALEALIDEGEIYLQIGDREKGEQVFIEFQERDLGLLDFRDLVEANKFKAHYHTEKGKFDEAYSILQPTIQNIIEWAKNTSEIESGFWNVEQEFLDAFELYTELLLKMDRPTEAVIALDQLKTINDASLYQNPMVKSSRLNERELTQYQRLTTQLDNLRKKQLSSEGDQLELQSQIDRLSAQKRTLDRKITDFADHEPIEMYEVQQHLSAQDRILHITELKDHYYLAVISRRDVQLRKIELDAESRNLLQSSVEELARGETDLNKLYRISTLLGVRQLPPHVENIILIPDSYLYQLPIEILPLEAPPNSYSYGEATYFIEKYQTQYLTTLNEFKEPEHSDREFSLDYVGFGISKFPEHQHKTLIPLPYARTEISQISRNLTNLKSHKTILDEESTEEAFRTSAPNSRIIHLATHSTVSDRDPLFSTIYMSQNKAGEEYNGQIFAYELFEMNLTNELIMLNSCESGSGSYLQGSGIVGISRALRYAGAKSLILNLWSVNDMMASDFAIRFYQSLNEGDYKSEALREAKIHFLKNKNANPHYWGPYMMIGNNQPVVKPYQTTNTLFAAGFMIYLVTLLGISYLKQNWNIN